MLSIKLLSNAEVFFFALPFFAPPRFSFSLAFQGLHSLLTFGIDLQYDIFSTFPYLYFHFLSQHTQSLSAFVILLRCGARNFQDSQCSLFSFSLTTVKFFAGVKKMEVHSMVKSYQLREWAYITPVAFQYSLVPATKE